MGLLERNLVLCHYEHETLLKKKNEVEFGHHVPPHLTLTSRSLHVVSLVCHEYFLLYHKIAITVNMF